MDTSVITGMVGLDNKNTASKPAAGGDDDVSSEGSFKHAPSNFDARSNHRQGLRRMDSRRSFVSRGSNFKSKASLLSTGSLSDLYGAGEEIKEYIHPYDNIFGKKINRYIQGEENSTIGISFAQFKEIKWQFALPNFTCDVLETICGFSMRQHLIEKESKREGE